VPHSLGKLLEPTQFFGIWGLFGHPKRGPLMRGPGEIKNGQIAKLMRKRKIRGAAAVTESLEMSLGATVFQTTNRFGSRAHAKSQS